MLGLNGERESGVPHVIQCKNTLSVVIFDYIVMGGSVAIIRFLI